MKKRFWYWLLRIVGKILREEIGELDDSKDRNKKERIPKGQ